MNTNRRTVFSRCVVLLLVLLGCTNSLWAQLAGHTIFFPADDKAEPVMAIYGDHVEVLDDRDPFGLLGYYSFDVTIPTGFVQSADVFHLRPSRLTDGFQYNDGNGKLVVIAFVQFTYHPTRARALPPRAVPQGGAPSEPRSIPVSNSANSFGVTCDGRFSVVVGGLVAQMPVPVSLVDLEAGREVDTLLFPGERGNSWRRATMGSRCSS